MKDTNSRVTGILVSLIVVAVMALIGYSIVKAGVSDLNSNIQNSIKVSI